MIWNNNADDLQEKEKIDAICKDLIEKLSKVEHWEITSSDGVAHKDYNLEVFEHLITRPKRVRIPRKWRRKIRYRIEKIYHCYEMESLGFLHDVILDKYPLHVWITSNERRQWVKENAKEDDYIAFDHWYYFKNESIAVAFKLRWM